MLLIIFFSVCNKAYGQTQNAPPTKEFTVVFEQITPNQHAQIRAFYIQYSGYVQHSISKQNTESTVVVYTSSAPIELLVNNFTKTAEHLNMKVLVRGANSHISIRFIQQKTTQLPYKEW